LHAHGTTWTCNFNRFCIPADQTIQASYRRVTPGQHTAVLQHIKDVDFTGILTENAQTAFDNFYNVALGLLDQFYPEKTITVKSRDPEYITPLIKSLLRKKNKGTFFKNYQNLTRRVW